MSTGLQIKQIKSIHLEGYRPFRDFTVPLGSLNVLVGANGSGKSALFEFLRFLRDGMTQEIPPGVIPDTVGQQIFHLGVQNLERRWTVPVEDQNQDEPPKRIVEKLFRAHGEKYVETLDAPLILITVDYHRIAEHCPQQFKPFVEFLEAVGVSY